MSSDSSVSFIFQNSDMSEANAIKMCQSLMYDIERVLSNNDWCKSIRAEELYRMAYTLVLHRYGDLLYDNLTNTFKNSISKNLSHINDNDKFFESMTTTCNDIDESMKFIRDIMMYMVCIYTQFVFFQHCILHSMISFLINRTKRIVR